jgi:hypothetical protein
MAEAGYPAPKVTPVAGPPSSDVNGSRSGTEGDLPESWRQVRELADQSYRWPTYLETYDRYIVYAAETEREGTIHIALGDAPREKAWGKDRRYTVAFLTSGAPQTPVAEFLETDDYDATRELLAVIRGSDGGRRMYGDSLPDTYGALKVAIYSDRIKSRGAWNKLAVVARDDDPDSMLNHALIQARRRGDV